ncbi:MAG: ABC-F family ATP-binding cassette domain-containing protein [Coriobacteriia bacterium]|nr:ABC-F family ATP-binding cassette domain-containing protein [Coriobacteriia bacterium]
MAHLLGCDDVHIEYPSRRLFSALSLGIDEGDRIGIVGGNGDGKSTLLSLLAGSIDPDSGRVIRRGGTTVNMLAQADTLDPASTVRQCIVGDMPEHQWASDARIRDIIGHLVGDISWDGVIGELSGGQRRRVDLARVLIDDSDVLMLDEPTNHLDVTAIDWLARHLQARWPKRAGALLVVTHDRWFLDEVCTSMWEVHDGVVDRFEGGYSAYVFQRVERAAVTERAEHKRRNLMRKELAWLARGPQARSTKPKFRVDAAESLIADEPPLRNVLELRQTAMTRLGKQVIDLEAVTVRFGETTVIDRLTWHIGAGDRIGILGENGSGKTTLLRLLQGALQPTSGTVRIGSTVQTAVLSQHLEELEALAGERVRDVLARYKTRYEFEGRELTPAQLLERLGFESAHLPAYVSTLSGGQKRRLQLMLILLDRPNVLILDEPDNDLDTDMLAVMESLFDTWPGTLLLVTHDRHLMERVTDDQFAVFDGKVRHLPGGVDEYLRLVARRASEPSDVMPGGAGRTAGVSERSLPRAQEYRLKKDLASSERRLRTLEAKAETIRAELHDADSADYAALMAIQERLDETRREIASLEDEWLRISELLG